MLNKITTLLGTLLASAFLIGLATTLTRSSMIGFWDVLPVFILMGIAIFMASNLIVARGGVEYVPPISLAFWRWAAVFLMLLPFTFNSLKKNSQKK